MLAILLAPVYLLLNFYILRWLILWMSACHRHFRKKWIRTVIVLGYLFISTALVSAFVLPPGNLRRFMKLLGNYWLGVLLYIILTVIIADLIRLLLIHYARRRSCRKGSSCGHLLSQRLHSRRVFVASGTFCIAVITAVNVWGFVNARHIRTTSYDVTIEKSVENIESLKVVLVADLHLGYNIGSLQMRQMVKKINAENPDLVVIAGDIFDNEYEALDNPDRLISILKGIQSRYGVYACYGNHDISEKILAGFTFGGKGQKKVSDLRMDRLLSDADITLLRDESVLIDHAFYLYGRPDAERPGRGIDRRKTPDEITSSMDLDKPVLVIDHEPGELQELADAGVDLDLCGHTHDGQLFPGNLFVRLMWENSCGYLKKGKMHNIVTSGVGLFGPNMRVGTRSEICAITVHFVK